MAATPKRSLKHSLAGSVEERSPRFLLGSLALAMVKQMPIAFEVVVLSPRSAFR